MSVVRSDWDTALGGERRDFPSTCWSRFLGGSDEEGGRSAVETLAQAYWKPIYSYIRSTWAKSNEDAKDLTQDFFMWMMESGFLRRADPARGRFRSFIKVALKHYLGMDLRKAGREKRGGGRKILELDGMADAFPGLELSNPEGRPPEEILDEAWRRTLFARAEAMLEETLKKAGKEVQFSIFRDFYLSPTAEVDYRELAARYGITTVDVSNWLTNAKRRFLEITTGLVAETVQSEEELRDEMKSLFGDPPA